jgi:hypothetical protein
MQVNSLCTIRPLIVLAPGLEAIAVTSDGLDLRAHYCPGYMILWLGTNGIPSVFPHRIEIQAGIFKEMVKRLQITVKYLKYQEVTAQRK